MSVWPSHIDTGAGRGNDARRKANQEEDAQDGDQDNVAPGARDAVSLRQRAAPMIDMLRRSAAENSDVTW